MRALDVRTGVRVAVLWALLAARPGAGARPAVAAADDGPGPAVGVVPSADPAVTAALEAGARAGADDAARAGGPRLVVRIGPAATTWGSGGSSATALAAAPGVVALLTPPDAGLAHETVQAAGKLGLPALVLSDAPTVRGTGSRWAVPAADGARDPAARARAAVRRVAAGLAVARGRGGAALRDGLVVLDAAARLADGVRRAAAALGAP